MKKILFILNLLLLAAIIALDVCLILSPSLALKSVTSACFVLVGIINAAYAIKAGADKKFIIFMLVGLVFAMAGDIVNYNTDDIYFITGTALFALAHVFYIVSYYFLCRFHLTDVIISACIFVPSALFITLAPIFDFGGVLMEVVCIVYALILSVMVGKALSNVRLRTDVSIIIAVGSILFFVSDLSLLLNMFGKMHTVPRILCLATYYPAQFILAFSMFVYALRKGTEEKLGYADAGTTNSEPVLGNKANLIKGDVKMSEVDIPTIIERQREYFKSGVTLNAKHRLKYLKMLYSAIQ